MYIPKSQICKVLRCAMQSIRKIQRCTVHIYYSVQLFLKTVLKVVFLKRFLCYLQIKLELEHSMLDLCREMVYICELAELLSPQIIKKIGSANCKSVCGRSANVTIFLSTQICGFAELICGPPTFDKRSNSVVLMLNTRNPFKCLHCIWTLYTL